MGRQVDMCRIRLVEEGVGGGLLGQMGGHLCAMAGGVVVFVEEVQRGCDEMGLLAEDGGGGIVVLVGVGGWGVDTALMHVNDVRCPLAARWARADRPVLHAPPRPPYPPYPPSPSPRVQQESAEYSPALLATHSVRLGQKAAEEGPALGVGRYSFGLARRADVRLGHRGARLCRLFCRRIELRFLYS